MRVCRSRVVCSSLFLFCSGGFVVGLGVTGGRFVVGLGVTGGRFVVGLGVTGGRFVVGFGVTGGRFVVGFGVTGGRFVFVLDDFLDAGFARGEDWEDGFPLTRRLFLVLTVTSSISIESSYAS